MGALEIISKERRQVMVAMLDLEKAYGRVNWSFILATLEHMNFGILFRHWISAMYCSSTASVIVNGRRSQEFILSRSLRQGCPMAPLLFVIQIEVLLNSLRAAPLVKGLQLGGGVEVLTGAIADDLLLITEAPAESTREAKGILDQYATLSEAKVNWDKSAYFLPAEYELSDDWTMKRIREADSERCLGVQISLTDSRPVQDTILVGRTEAAISKCRGATGLSLLGKATIITSLIFSLLWHIAAVIMIYKPTIRKVKRAAAKYLWKHKAEEQEGFITKVAWDKVTKPKDQGGLGIIDPEKQNTAHLGKWIMKASTQTAQRCWLEIIQYIIQQQFHLNTTKEVWTCLQMSSFVNRRPKSIIGRAWWIAWKRLRPPEGPDPRLKEEILIQPLFDNPRIRQGEGSTFSAALTPRGSFGRKWVEKGVTQVKEIWSEDAKEWKSERELRNQLGRLRGVGEKLQQLMEAIPQAWQEILKEDNKLKFGAWYKDMDTPGVPDEFYRVEEGGEEGGEEEEWIASRWVMAQAKNSEGNLRREGQRLINREQNWIAVRAIRTLEINGREGWRVIQGGKAITELRLDPGAVVWTATGTCITLAQYTSKLGRKTQEDQVSYIQEIRDRTGQKMEQESRQAQPEANEVPLSEEDRIRSLIAKCYEDGVSPENLRHGEFVIKNGVRIFKVNTQIDKLTTAWLKERTMTVIFQGEARDLLIKTREDLIRAYENGWQRKKTFARGFKRGRVHGEGPNVMSYVARSREVAQWLLAKADDVVVIRGVEYKMLFKAWMTRAELEEQRRQDDETKFWVVALRVPLRAMFHLRDLVTQAMGPIITRHPPEPDATRPKLMNLKFKLAREAEEKFEAILPMKLDDGELYNA
ncbi:hypothetical protein CBR_g4599 [Chara braunii]|uniref:Reverse transcriptase domain-containing protein n=1 Tax=Chara braunii TaxID=69332 RepID=A0A388KIC7_CHABU|nr:hypothetical protein CBR_g4599 [Chara braunii]|eukprot:GBG69768.1 hypothetical protein CBR_g4599 [Chara braunii]